MPSAPLDLRKSIIPVHVLVKGPKASQIIRMALDTGASYTTIPNVVASYLGCDVNAGSRMEIFTASGIEYVSLVRLRSLTCLGLEAPDIEVACLTLPADSPVEGLLGLNFLKRFNVHLDFLHGTLRILRSQEV